MNPLLPPRVAIYARYSSDLQNPSSVDDQIALCQKLATDQFRAVPGKVLIYSDAAISGATMDRPGIKRLLAAVQAGRVDVVIAEGLDRLSRSLKDIAAFHDVLMYHNAMIWTSHEGQITELHVGLKGTMNALFLRDMKAKVRRGQSARIAAGFAASSCPYGYRVVRGVVDAKGRPVNGLREIDEAEASVVHRIFSEFAAGRKIPLIVAGLNADGIPAPSGGLWKRNSIMGGAKKQEGILRNEVYAGVLVFNRTRIIRDPITNKSRYVVNPESEWTRTHVPEYRIIDEHLWRATRELVEKKGDDDDKPTLKKRLLNTHNQHALTGWVKCGWCGGPKSLANQSRYLCSTHRYAKSCKNSRGTKEPVLMDAVFKALYRRVTEGEDFRPAIERALTRETDRRKELERQSGEAEVRINRLLDAIERGVNQERAAQRIVTLEAQLQLIAHEMSEDLPEIPGEPKIRRTLVEGLREVEQGDVTRQREMFSTLLSEIMLTPLANQPRGETISITLRDEGWPDFWRSLQETR